MRRLLVTGAAGFIGANFIEYWQQQYPQDFILALDVLTYAGNIRNLERARQQPNVEFVQGNIADQALIEHCLRHYQLDTLVNFAAESHVDRSISDPAIFCTPIFSVRSVCCRQRARSGRKNRAPVVRHRLLTGFIMCPPMKYLAIWASRVSLLWKPAVTSPVIRILRPKRRPIIY